MTIELSGDTFGKNIAYLRRKYAISYRSLGKLCGMDPNILHGIEQNQVLPILSAESLRRLCQIFNVPMEDLTTTLLEPPSCDPEIGV